MIRNLAFASLSILVGLYGEIDGTKSIPNIQNHNWNNAANISKLIKNIQLQQFEFRYFGIDIIINFRSDIIISAK